MTRASRYRILEQIGKGGTGHVFKAEDTVLRRKVALKFLPRGLMGDPIARARLLREAQATSALEHPNLCTIFEIDESDDGGFFIAMAFCEGEDLQKRIARGPLPVEEALEIAIQMAQGLEAAHRAGVIHRDVKPGNVLLGDEGAVKLVDFGTAKVLEGRDVSTTEGLAGTPAYMSPEQLGGETVDGRTDVWALGVVLFEMLTGETPFGDLPLTSLLRAILEKEPRKLADVRPEVPAIVAAIVGRCLIKNREDRYASMGELLRELLETRDILGEPTRVLPALSRADLEKPESVGRWPVGWPGPGGVNGLLGAIGLAALLLVGFAWWGGPKEGTASPPAAASKPSARDVDSGLEGSQAHHDEGLASYAAHDFEDAVEAFEAAFEADPEFWISRSFLALTLSEMGRHTEAIETARGACDVSGSAPETIAILAYVEGHSGAVEDAATTLAELEARAERGESVAPTLRAIAHLGVADEEAAMSWLERAALKRDPLVSLANRLPPFDRLHGQPRYERVLAALGLKGR